MLFAQCYRSMGLDDVCDRLRLKTPVLTRFGAAPPSRNGLSNAKSSVMPCLQKNSSGRLWGNFSMTARHLHPARRATGC
jgi:hypothetical protein